MTALETANCLVKTTADNGDLVITSDGEELLLNGQPFGDDVIAEEPVNADFSYIGNLNSHKFHLPTCNHLPAEHNRKYFVTRDDAVDEGYSPCGVCNP